MILAPLLNEAVSAITTQQPTAQPLIDFVRPIFLKIDPAGGAQEFNQLMESPASPANQEIIRTKLRDHLEGHPEAVHKLQALLEM